MAALTLAELKHFLRYDPNDVSNDITLNRLIKAGQKWVERYTGILLEQREVTEALSTFPVSEVDLKHRPVVADSMTISYRDGSLAVINGFTAFDVFEANGTYRLAPLSEWPSGARSVVLTYDAGYSSVDQIPSDLLHAICVYCGMSDEDRASPGSSGWMALKHILKLYRKPVMA